MIGVGVKRRGPNTNMHKTKQLKYDKQDFEILPTKIISAFCAMPSQYNILREKVLFFYTY